jgi:hypothetical protein
MGAFAHRNASAEALGAAVDRDRLRPPARRTAATAPLLLLFSIVFLYTPLYFIGDYAVTVGGVCAVIVLAATVLANGSNVRGVEYLVAAIVYPVIVYAAHVAFGTKYAVDFSRFILSFCLWVLSASIVWAAFQRKCLLLAQWAYPALVGLTALGSIQFVGAKYLGTWIGFDIVAPLVSFDLYDSYLGLGVSDKLRAIGTYYEPSMFGRVIVTLMAICLFQGRSLSGIIAIFAVNIVTTQSFGLLIFGALVIMFFVRISLKHILLVLLCSAFGFIVFYDFVLGRISGGEEISTDSTYIRMVIPLDALSVTLTDFPFGVPIGANAAVVQNTIYGKYLNFAETKITNGLYELILYFGWPGILVAAALTALMFFAYATGQRAVAIIVANLLLATAVSSSYLSLESSLLLYVLIASLRSSEQGSRSVPASATIAAAGARLPGTARRAPAGRRPLGAGGRFRTGQWAHVSPRP